MRRAARRFRVESSGLRLESRAQVLEDEAVDIRCFRGHKLTYLPKFRRPFTGWGCDMGDFGEEAGEILPSRVDGLKETYGLQREEEWNCLRGFEYPQWWYDSDTPLYMCERCQFCLCDRCYERAYYFRLYTEVLETALRETQAVEWMHSKLMVVGEGGAGKTSTVRSLLGEGFTAEWESTVGASLTHAKVAKAEKSWVKKEAGEAQNLLLAAAEIVELPEKKRFLHEGRVVVTGKEGEVLPHASGYDSDSDSEGKRYSELFKLAERLDKEEKRREKGDVEVEKAAGGGKESAEIAGKMDVKLVDEANRSKGGIKFTIWDYGGQSVFYSLHHLFLTKYGVYLVVFNLAAFLKHEEASREFLYFWLNSIKLHAPEAPLLLVGTYLDQLDAEGADLKNIEKRVGEYVKVYERTVRNQRDTMSFFPLSNRTGSGMKTIRRAIEQVARAQDYLYTKVPVRWLKCLDMLTSDQGESWVSLTKAKDFAKQSGIDAASEVEAMLHYMNQVGVILHFTSTIALEQKVIVNPQWLIDQVGKIIRDVSIHHYRTKDFAAVGLEKDLKNLCEKAIASYDILLHLWSRQTTDFLIDLMRRFMLLSDWKFNESDGMLYLIPCLLKGKQNFQPKSGLQLRYDFQKSFLPEGVTQRLVCLCVEYAIRQGTTREPIVYHDSAEVYLPGDVMISLQETKSAINVAFSPIDLQSPDKYCIMINSMFRKLNDDAMSGGLEWKLLFQDTDGGFKERSALSKESVWRNSTTEKVQNPREVANGRLDLEGFMGSL